jgi:hypothetical protein
MRKLPLIILSGTVIWFASSIQLMGQTIHRIGGPRDLVVVFESNSEEYRLTIQMTPVSAFDEGANMELTRIKSRAYAISFLGKELSKSGDTADQKNKVLQLANVVVKVLPRMASKSSVLIRVPRDGIAWVKKAALSSNIASPIPSTFSNASSLLSRKADLEQTMSTIHQRYFVFYQKESEVSDRRFLAFDSYERLMERLKSIIENDRLLVKVEREELHQMLNARLQEYTAYIDDLGDK